MYNQVMTWIKYNPNPDKLITGDCTVRAISGYNSEKVWNIIDELMETINAVYPQLYQGVMQRISKIDT